MEVQAISFTGKAPKLSKAKKAYNRAMAEALGQSDKDYLMLTKKSQTKAVVNPESFINNAKKFFGNFFG